MYSNFTTSRCLKTMLKLLIFKNWSLHYSNAATIESAAFKWYHVVLEYLDQMVTLTNLMN